MFLFDIGVTGITFVDVPMVRHMCKVLQISSILLAKPKLVRDFDSRSAPDITYAIYPTLTV